MIRTIYVATAVALYFLISLIFLLPLVIILGEKKGTNLARKLAKSWGKFIIKITGSKVEVIIKNKEDLESISEDEPFVLIANHQSNIDIPLLLGYFPKQIGFVAKKEMQNWPIIGLWMKRIKCVFLDRKNPREGIKSMRVAIENIKNGYSIVIFPEGTRSKTGEIDEFKKGSFKLAIDPGVKIIPVTIKGTIDVLGRDSKKIRKNDNLQLIIDKSINPEGMEKEELSNLNEKIRNIILENYK